ncbi:MAG: putative metal-binding motif-containing protein [Deltaproteobacteria bacterium]|nr:putative metal-binding motif-containing protein [Deltaproteobacteria bacterium]
MLKRTGRAFGGFVTVGLLLAAGCATSGGSTDAVGDAEPPDDAGDGAGDGGTACTRDRDCDDRISCTIDHCGDGTCVHEACTDCCPDGLSCYVGLGCGPAPTPCTTDGDCGDGVRCTLDRCSDGSFCEHLPQDGLCDDGEICLAALGCIPDPPDSCTSAAECFPDRFCLGSWYCDPEFGCQFEAPPDCADEAACTVDTCDDAAGGCVHTAPDEDGDAHIDAACGGDDCDDANEDVNPEMPELPCNGIDDDCDPATLETCCTPEPCSTSCGTTGVRECNPDGTPGACIPPDETCNGSDDDCDTVADGAFECVLAAAEACATSCGSAGSRVCQPGCTWSACAPPAESCSGSDDDCDDLTDEGFECVYGSSGACTTTCSSIGTHACSGACAWDTCIPPVEVCNGSDDDCDAALDEGFTCVAGTSRACTTGCGSTGSQPCEVGCTWGGCAPPVEMCSGIDDDCDGSTDEGFLCVMGSSGTCTTTCASTGSRTCIVGTGGCTWDTCVPPAETCNGVDDNCNAVADDGFACVRGASGSCTTSCGSTGGRVCGGDCTWGGCAAPAEICSGFDEDCDGATDEGFTCVLGSAGPCTTTCSSTGTQLCGGGCVWSGVCTPPAEVCNGVDDDCDAVADDGYACVRGSSGSCPTSCGTTGTRGCAIDCSWGVCVPPADTCNGADDDCDTVPDDGFFCVRGSTTPCTSLPSGGWTGGTATCANDCSGWVTTGCTSASFDPSGNYTVSPTATYTCAFGLVNINVTMFTFVDSGSSLSVSPAMNGCCVMTGASARSTRNINVTCTCPGGCNEIYTLTGSFDTDNHWTGTLTANYVGSCFGCALRTWSVSGTRM